MQLETKSDFGTTNGATMNATNRLKALAVAALARNQSDNQYETDTKKPAQLLHEKIVCNSVLIRAENKPEPVYHKFLLTRFDGTQFDASVISGATLSEILGIFPEARQVQAIDETGNVLASMAATRHD